MCKGPSKGERERVRQGNRGGTSGAVAVLSPELELPAMMLDGADALSQRPCCPPALPTQTVKDQI